MDSAAAMPWGVQLPTFKRPDGRTSNLQLRPPTCEFGVLKNASGSARFKMGLTSVLAAVHGPKESSGGRRGPVDKGNIQVVVRPLFGNKSLSEKYTEATLTAILSSMIDLEQMLHTSINIILQPEENDGGLLSCCLNAATCALLDSGLPCISTFLSVPLVRQKNQTPGGNKTSENKTSTSEMEDSSSEDGMRYALDPTLEELTSNSSSFDSSTYMSVTLDLHSGSLIQMMPEIVIALQDSSPIPVRNEPVLWLKHWSSTVEMLDVAAGCCKVLGEVVRKAMAMRLDLMVEKTIKTNNLLQMDEDSE